MAYTLPQQEHDLIDACIEKNRLAQKRLYVKYKDAMFTLTYRITGDFSLAGEALQDGFLNVFKNLSKFRRESSLGAWIKTIMVRAALTKVKKKIVFEELGPSSISSYIDWGDYLDAEYLEKAILSLPEGFRMVFILIEVEGYTHKEVGKILNIKEGTSKSQLFYAKKKLRTLIDRY